MESALETAVANIATQAAAFLPIAGGVVGAALGVAFMLWGVPKAVSFFKSIAN